MRKYSKRELYIRDMTLFLNWLQFIKGYGVTRGEGFRTNEQQRIYRDGWFYDGTIMKWKKTIKKIKSWVLYSQHQKRLADDLHIWNSIDGKTYITDAEWLEVGLYWCNMDSKNRWGGNFGLNKNKHFAIPLGKDRWHFERRD